MSRVSDLLSLVRFRAFDVTTEGGRSRERYRRAGFTAAAAFAAKLVGVVTILVTVPITLGYLGSERYGLWMTISSVSLMLGFADLGIGNGVLNVAADAYGRDDRKLGREAASSGFFLLSLVCVALWSCLRWSTPSCRGLDVYNVTSADAMSEAGPATAVFFLVWALNIPLDVVQRVQLGYQKGFVNYAWQAAGSCFALAGAVLAISTEAGLPWLVLALTGGPLLAVALNGVVEFGWVRPWLRPAWSFVSPAAAGRICGSVCGSSHPVRDHGGLRIELLRDRPGSRQFGGDPVRGPGSALRLHRRSRCHADRSALAGLRRGHDERRHPLDQTHARPHARC